MTDDLTVNAINGLIDTVLEDAETTLLHLDTNRKSIVRRGKFKRIHFPTPKSSATLISSTAVSPVRGSSVGLTREGTMTSETVSTFPSAMSDGEKSSSKESFDESSLPPLPPPPRRRHHNQHHTPRQTSTTRRAPVDVFRFPLAGEDPFINSKDEVYHNVNNQSLLIVRNLKDGTSVDPESVDELRDYFHDLKRSEICAKCHRPIKTEGYRKPRSRAPSKVSSSIVIPEAESIRSRREVSCSGDSVPPSISSKLSSATTIDFTTTVRDRKTRSSVPMHFEIKCERGQPQRVFINGRAFGPCENNEN